MFWTYGWDADAPHDAVEYVAWFAGRGGAIVVRLARDYGMNYVEPDYETLAQSDCWAIC